MKAENENYLDKYVIYASGPNKGLNKYGEDPYKDLPKKAKWRKSLNSIEVDIGYPYLVDLDECTTSEELMDWIFQLMGKNKDMIEPVIYDFLDMFQRVFSLTFKVDPQAALDKQWNWKTRKLEGM